MYLSAVTVSSVPSDLGIRGLFSRVRHVVGRLADERFGLDQGCLAQLDERNAAGQHALISRHRCVAVENGVLAEFVRHEHA